MTHLIKTINNTWDRYKDVCKERWKKEPECPLWFPAITSAVDFEPDWKVPEVVSQIKFRIESRDGIEKVFGDDIMICWWNNGDC